MLLSTRRRLLLVCVAALLWGVEWRSGKEDPSLQRVQEAGRLVVGVDPSYPPFAFFIGEDEIAGYDLELAQEMADRMGVETQFTLLDIGGMYDAVAARRVDVILGIYPLREFSKRVRYSRPYFNAGQVLVGPDRLQPWEAANRIVGIESGSTADLASTIIGERLGGPNLQRYSSIEAMEVALLQGHLDGVVLDAVSSYELSQRHPDLVPLAGPVTDEPFVFGVHYHDASLLREIDQILADLETEAFLHRLEEEWLR